MVPPDSNFAINLMSTSTVNENNENLQATICRPMGWGRYTGGFFEDAEEDDSLGVTPLLPSNQLPSPRKVAASGKRAAAAGADEDPLLSRFRHKPSLSNKKPKLSHHHQQQHQQQESTMAGMHHVQQAMAASNAAAAAVGGNTSNPLPMAALTAPFLIPGLALQHADFAMARQLLVSQALSASTAAAMNTANTASAASTNHNQRAQLLNDLIASELALFSSNPAALAAMTGGKLPGTSLLVGGANAKQKNGPPMSIFGLHTTGASASTSSFNVSCPDTNDDDDGDNDTPNDVACLNLGDEFLPRSNTVTSNRLCDCGMALCREIGYPNRGSFAFASSNVNEWCQALDITNATKKRQIEQNPSQYRIAYWHFDKQHRTVDLQTGKVRLNKEQRNHGTDSASAVLPIAHLQSFVDDYKASTAASASPPHPHQAKPQQERQPSERMLQLHQYWAHVRRMPTLEP